MNTAAKFLSSPNVQKSPSDMKIAFLKKKGLSDVEIDLAIKKCDAALQSRVSFHILIDHHVLPFLPCEIIHIAVRFLFLVR